MGNLRLPGCYNQPRPTNMSGYFVLTRHYHPDGRFHLEDQWIPFVMSKECMNDHRHPHPECDGCKWRKP